jgi:hypothetical protein
MLCVVAPVDQIYVVPALEVRVTLPPAQKVVGPLAVIVGAGGTGGGLLIGTGTDAAEVHPPELVTVNV